MKSPAKCPKLIMHLTMIALMAIFTACENTGKKPGIPSAIDEINDTLRTGNVASAMAMTDSLKRKALERKDSALWCEAIVQQGVNAFYGKDPRLVLVSADTAITWLENRNKVPEKARLLAKAYQTKGAFYDQYHFNADSTALYFRKAVEQGEKSGLDRTMPQIYANYANAMRLGSSLDSAAIYYHKAISKADSLGLPTEEYISLYNGIASVFTDMRDFENSAIWWKKSMETIGSMNQYEKFNTLTGIGNDRYYKNDYEGAQEVFSGLRNMLDSIPGSDWEIMFTEVNLADTYIRTGRPREALDMLDKAADYFTRTQPNPMVMSYIQTLRMRGATYLGDYEGGLEMARLYPEADTLRMEQHLARLKAMEDLYTNIGNHRLAYITRCRYDHLYDSLRSNRLSQQISTLNAIYQRDHRILNLEAGNTRQRASIYKLTAGIAISLAIIAGLLLLYLIRRINARKREDRMMNKIISLRQENLRNRVTPHFIYNALNHELHNVRKGKPSHLDSLVDLIRKQQVVASEILVPFADELKFTEDYIKVIGDNDRDPLDYECLMAPDISPDFAFPSMSLEILVENAFKHGFTTLEPLTVRKLQISVRRTAGNLIEVSVFNNCGNRPSGAERGGTGLRVLLETIKLINEHNRPQIHFTTESEAELDGIRGHRATITLPDNLRP